MGKTYGVARIDKAPQKLAKSKRSVAFRLLSILVKFANRVIKVRSLNKSHCIKRPAIRMRPQAIDWNDSRVFEAAGDDGFSDKPLSIRRAGGKLGPNFFQRDSSSQFGIRRDKDLSQTSPGMRPQDVKANS